LQQTDHAGGKDEKIDFRSHPRGISLRKGSLDLVDSGTQIIYIFRPLTGDFQIGNPGLLSREIDETDFSTTDEAWSVDWAPNQRNVSCGSSRAERWQVRVSPPP
jgi:hypothetical protein